jgi:exonuclease III
VSKELSKYKLDLVRVQEVRWEGSGPKQHSSPEGQNEKEESETVFFFVHKRILSAAKRVEFVSDRMSYIILRGHWFHIFVLNVHAPTEEPDDVKASIYEELDHMFEKFPTCHMKTLIGDFNIKVHREDIFKSSRNENPQSDWPYSHRYTMALEYMMCDHSRCRL